MKTAIITLTLLVALATPSLATDSLGLLAKVSHLQAENASDNLEDMKNKQQTDQNTPKPPKQPK